MAEQTKPGQRTAHCRDHIRVKETNERVERIEQALVGDLEGRKGILGMLERGDERMERIEKSLAVMQDWMKINGPFVESLRDSARQVRGGFLAGLGRVAIGVLAGGAVLGVVWEMVKKWL